MVKKKPKKAQSLIERAGGEESSVGPIDPNKVEIIPSHLIHEPADQKKEPKKGPENAQEALDDILAGKKGISVLFDENTKYPSFRQEVLNLSLDYIDNIRRYNGIVNRIWESMKSQGFYAPASLPEYAEKISAGAKEAGIPGKLLGDINSSRSSTADIEFGYLDIAVRILAKEKRYNPLFVIAEGCASEAQKRGIAAGPNYLRKAADILLENNELRNNPAYSSLVFEMKVLAEKYRYTGLQDLK